MKSDDSDTIYVTMLMEWDFNKFYTLRYVTWRCFCGSKAGYSKGT